MDPPGTYSRKLKNGFVNYRMSPGVYHLHAQVVHCFFKPEILDNIWVIQVFQSLTLGLQGLNHRHLPRIVLIAGGARDLDLFDGNHFSRRRIESQVYTSVRAFPYQLAPHPFEDGYWAMVSK